MPKVVGQRSHKGIIQARKKEVITFHFHNFIALPRKLKVEQEQLELQCYVFLTKRVA